MSDPNKQKKLKAKLGANFQNNYLAGYFETTQSSIGTWYIDYNQALGEMYQDAEFLTEEENPEDSVLLRGRVGSNGQASGKVKVVHPDRLDDEFEHGSILVCTMTTPNHVPLMQKAAAIVTDQGGILCHAAIVARELNIPCIVGTLEATIKLNDGDLIFVDAVSGVISRAE